LRSLAASAAATNILAFEPQDSRSGDLWHYISQAVPLCLQVSPLTCVFKIGQLPSCLGATIAAVQAIAERGAVSSAVLARASGILYFAVIPETKSAGTGDEQQQSPEALTQLAAVASEVFAFCAREGASATLPWCPTQLKRRVNVWGAPRADAKLLRGIKAAFDPQSILSPGRAP
jgi:hypothetical protein